MYVACRMINDNDSCDSTCVAYWSRGDVIHTELVLDEKCNGRKRCPYCTPADTPRPLKHRLTYVIVSAPRAYAHVTLCTDRHLEPNPRYRYVSIPVNEVQIQIVKAFLDQQLHKSFNYLGFYLNFTSCCCVGYTGGNKQRALWSRRWFCSELCVAALQQIDALSDYRPCKVSPTQLLHILVYEIHCQPLEQLPLLPSPPLPPPPSLLRTPTPTVSLSAPERLLATQIIC